MKIQILAFAQLKTDLGFSQKEYITDVDVLSLGDLAQKIFAEQNQSVCGGEIRLALNEEFADPNTLLKNNDVVALIPPVSGG